MHSSNSRSPSKTRTTNIGYANGLISPHPLKADTMSLKRNQSGSVASNGSTKKKKSPKPYEPIRLPEDILTIQAHTCSTPVTELPYLLIAAHIGALPTTRQFYPATSSSHTPLTIFRDMFVMTVDVRGYKQSSVRLSTEGHLIIIECLQSEVPQVVHTQTGTVDAQDKYVMDPTPKLNSMPIHTSFNYVQHRVKLPEDFAEEGLKVGMDEVSGHIIITGRLVHNQNANFPEPWNKNKVVKKGRGPMVNTSSLNLSREDARKLAAWQAVQGKSREKSTELVNTSLVQYGKKQWLEKEGAKLRSIQHKALKTNIKKLTELKKNSPLTTEKSDVNLKPQSSTINQQQQQQKMGSQNGEAKELVNLTHDHMTSDTKLNDPILLQADPSINYKQQQQHHYGKGGNGSAASGGKNEKVKGKESKVKVSFQSDNGGGGGGVKGGILTKKKSKMDAELSLKKKSLNKLSDGGGGNGNGNGGGKNDKRNDKKKSLKTDDPENNKITKKRTNKTVKANTTDSAPDFMTLPNPIKEQFRSNMNISSNVPAPQNSDQINTPFSEFHPNSSDESSGNQLIEPEALPPHPQVSSDKMNPILVDLNKRTENDVETTISSQNETKTHGGSLSVPAISKPQYSPSINGAMTETFDLGINQDSPHKICDQIIIPGGQGVCHSISADKLADEGIAKLDKEEMKGQHDEKHGEVSEDPIGQQDKKMWETLLQMAVTSSTKAKRGKGGKSPSPVRS